MPEIHGIQHVLSLLQSAIESNTGAEVKEGVRVLLPKAFQVHVQYTGSGKLEIKCVPSVDIFIDRVLGVSVPDFLKVHGTIEKIILSPAELSMQIDGLPDVAFKVVS